MFVYLYLTAMSTGLYVEYVEFKSTLIAMTLIFLHKCLKCNLLILIKLGKDKNYFADQKHDA